MGFKMYSRYGEFSSLSRYLMRRANSLRKDKISTTKNKKKERRMTKKMIRR